MFALSHKGFFAYMYIVHILYKIIELKQHNPQNSSFHLILGLPLGLLAAINLSIHYSVYKATFILYHCFSSHLSPSLHLCYQCFLLQSLSYNFISHTIQSGYTYHSSQNFYFFNLQSRLIPVLPHPCLASIHQGWCYHCIISSWPHYSAPYSQRSFFSEPPLLLLLCQSSTPIHL